MARKRKLVTKKRVRFCQLDYYRYLHNQAVTDIQGITNYYCTANTIVIFYDNCCKKEYFVNKGEKQLKEVIKIINAYIGGSGDGTQQQQS
jgi:hypothetical protein